MPNFSRTITVKEDIDTVYEFLSDFRNLEKWAEGDDGELNNQRTPKAWLSIQS
jgi:uncharacterized protein YndB with AHSA1/START domain